MELGHILRSLLLLPSMMCIPSGIHISKKSINAKTKSSESLLSNSATIWINRRDLNALPLESSTFTLHSRANWLMRSPCVGNIPFFLTWNISDAKDKSEIKFKWKAIEQFVDTMASFFSTADWGTSSGVTILAFTSPSENQLIFLAKWRAASLTDIRKDHQDMSLKCFKNNVHFALVPLALHSHISLSFSSSTPVVIVVVAVCCLLLMVHIAARAETTC